MFYSVPKANSQMGNFLLRVHVKVGEPGVMEERWLYCKGGQRVQWKAIYVCRMAVAQRTAHTHHSSSSGIFHAWSPPCFSCSHYMTRMAYVPICLPFSNFWKEFACFGFAHVQFLLSSSWNTFMGFCDWVVSFVSSIFVEQHHVAIK